MREDPDPHLSLARGCDPLFVCKRGEVPPGPHTCGYRGPAQPVTDETPEGTPIAADMEGNHADGSINVLQFRTLGVTSAWPGSELYQRCREVLSTEGCEPPRKVGWRTWLYRWGYLASVAPLVLGIAMACLIWKSGPWTSSPGTATHA